MLTRCERADRAVRYQVGIDAIEGATSLGDAAGWELYFCSLEFGPESRLVSLYSVFAFLGTDCQILFLR